ncbi:MAG: rRNA (cytidine-2'-O-)-methyltransferase, partial [Verrucomicrobiae bacterium]|nr:rRNA (cytidine-2'-O-)-methyltransferase [Verrucomicrobiae bacterium]
ERRLRALAALPGTLVLYESPHRLAAMLLQAAAVFGERPAAVARELTKKFEEYRRGTAAELAAWFAAHPPKGELVFLVGPEEKAG